MNNKEYQIFTRSGLKIANNYDRIEHNSRGQSYIEINKKDIIMSSLFIPPNKLYKLDRKWHSKEDYVEFRTIRDDVKIYYQISTDLSSSYANYRVGFFYVNINDVVKEDRTLLKFTL